MKKRFQLFVSFATCAIVLLLLLAACAPGGRTNPRTPDQALTPDKNRNMGQNLGTDNNRLLRLDERSPGAGQGTADTQRAQNIKEKLEAINGLGNVNVVVMDNTALVGYSVTGAADRADNIKDEVERTARQADPSITRVVATGEGDAAAKIGQLAKDAANNRPMDDIRNRFNQLINEINTTAS